MKISIFPKRIRHFALSLTFTCLVFLLHAREPGNRTFRVQKKSTVVYPDSLRLAGIEGKVVLKVLLDEEGNYVKHQVLESGHPLFLQEVEAFIPNMALKPAVFQSKKTRFWITVPFSFMLENGRGKPEIKRNSELYKWYS